MPKLLIRDEKLHATTFVLLEESSSQAFNKYISITYYVLDINETIRNIPVNHEEKKMS
jgi:hypothetical protein